MLLLHDNPFHITRVGGALFLEDAPEPLISKMTALGMVNEDMQLSSAFVVELAQDDADNLFFRMLERPEKEAELASMLQIISRLARSDRNKNAPLILKGLFCYATDTLPPYFAPVMHSRFRTIYLRTIMLHLSELLYEEYAQTDWGQE